MYEQVAASGIGYGLQSIMGLYNMISANRKMRKLGNRPTLTPPKELLEAQAARKEMSKKDWGFTQSMYADARRRGAGETNALMNTAVRTGAPANLVYAGLNIGRNASDLNIGAKSDIMNREQQNMNFNKAEDLSMKIADIGMQEQQQSQQVYDNTMMALARQMQSGTQSLYNTAGTLGTMGYGLMV
jgi:hypothetical protein